MINGTGSVSLRKKDLENQKIPTVGFQKTVFAHKATVGQTGINLAALTTPSELTSLGFSQPSVGELQNANLLFYRNNLKLVSSLRGQLVDFLSYTVAGSTQITFQGFTAADGEIFVGTIDYNAVSGVKVVDASPTVATGTLAANTRDFNSGSPFKVGMYPSTQVGAVLVYLDGMQQFRNTGNSSTVLDGNYYEVDAGGGLGVIIRFNLADTAARSVLVVSNGILSERPDGSMMATIEGVQGQINNLATYVAAAVGQPLATVLGGAPSNVDLKAFGDRVLTLEQNRARIDQSNVWTAYQPIPGRTDGSTIAAGILGETILWSRANTNVAAAWTNIGSIALNPGRYILHGVLDGSGTSTDVMNLGWSTSNSGAPNITAVAAVMGIRISAPMPVTILNVTAATTYYIMAYRSTGATANFGASGDALATRIG